MKARAIRFASVRKRLMPARLSGEVRRRFERQLYEHRAEIIAVILQQAEERAS